MPAIAYTVTATLPDEAVAREYLEWLRAGHLAAVVAGGADQAYVVRVTDPPTPIQVEARYRFVDEAALARYLHDAAPSLRADGLRRFPPERGITFVRRVGDTYPVEV